MSDYVFHRAKREEVGLIIGLVGPSGSGKTFSAMRIAAGIVGPGKQFAVIDTESRRALHYADKFAFDHCELRPPFRPDNYADVIRVADKAGYGAIVVDSSSHEWAGEGGILDWQEEELNRMAGDDYRKRESCKMASWIKPKMSHKQMVQRLLQTKAHLILCFRAEEKMKLEKDQHGKVQIVPVGWQPICSKEMPYELTVSFLLSPDKPGVGIPLKLQEQHKVIFPAGALLDEAAGRAISEWANPSGGCVEFHHPIPPPPSSGKPTGLKPGSALHKKIEASINEAGIDREMFKVWLESIGWLARDEGELSMSDLTDKYAKALVDKWDSAKKTFSQWVDQRNAEVTK